jgi:hypothetical protein
VRYEIDALAAAEALVRVQETVSNIAIRIRRRAEDAEASTSQDDETTRGDQ